MDIYFVAVKELQKDMGYKLYIYPLDNLIIIKIL
jgi:hypothetical protein